MYLLVASYYFARGKENKKWEHENLVITTVLPTDGVNLSGMADFWIGIRRGNITVWLWNIKVVTSRHGQKKIMAG
jgi:hypothetical protein